MRKRQSSVTTDTQLPVRSMGAIARALPGVGAAAGCCAARERPNRPTVKATAAATPTRAATGNKRLRRYARIVMYLYSCVINGSFEAVRFGQQDSMVSRSARN